MEIDAVGGRVTGLILALVDVQAVLGTGDESVTASGREGGGSERTRASSTVRQDGRLGRVEKETFTFDRIELGFTCTCC